MESFNLNIIPGKDRPVCHASQYDIGRTIHVNLFEGFNVFTLDGTEVISISVRKPDGNVVTESVTNTSDSYVEFVTTEQMTACHGSNLCELKIEKGADVIGTMNFILEVEQDPLDGGVQSDTNIHNLQTQVADLVAIEVADQYDSANVIFDAAPTPGHGNGYTVTSEGIATELALKQDITDNSLTTTDHTIVGAINELDADKQDASDSNLTTTDQTIVGAINELNSNFGNYEPKHSTASYNVSDQNVANLTETSVYSVNLGPGTYIFSASIEFKNNSVANKNINVNLKAGLIRFASNSSVIISGGYYPFVNVCGIYTVSETTAFTVNCSHVAGVTVSVGGQAYAYKIA